MKFIQQTRVKCPWDMKMPDHSSKALASVLMLILLAACGSTPVKNPENLCDIFEQKRSWYHASVKAQKKWGNPLHIPLAIMYQESTFQRRARPPRKYYLGFIPGRRLSSAYGYAQVVDGTWSEYVRSTGEKWRERNEFDDALDFVHFYINRIGQINGIPKNDAYSLYLNYHEGTAGFRRKSHESKPRLLQAASRVQARADLYATQYSQCEKSLQSGWFARLFDW